MPSRAAVADVVKSGKRNVGRALRSRRDARIVRTIQREARAAGATLANGGKGGLDARLALKVFRRDKYRCTNEHCPTPKKNLDLDHISGHPKEIAEDPEASERADLKKGVELGHVSDEDALHVLCRLCHVGKGGVHARENQIEDGKKPTPMRGTDR